MTLKDSYSTLSEAAKELGVTRQTVARWVSEDDIAAEKVGRETLIQKSEIERFKSDRLMTAETGKLVNLMVDYIRDKYKYPEFDKIDFFRFDPKNADFWFYVEKEGNVYTVVKVTVGKPTSIAERTPARFMLGMKFPILGIHRQKCNQAQLEIMMKKYLRKQTKKEKGKKTK